MLYSRQEILTIVSMLSTESVMFTPHHKVVCLHYCNNVTMVIYQREQANAMRNKLISLDGDHMMLINIYKAYKSAKGNKVSLSCIEMVIVLCVCVCVRVPIPTQW